MIALGLALALVPLNTVFASPVTIHMDGYLVDVTDTPVNLIALFMFRLYDAAAGVSAVHNELAILPVFNGNFSYNLGSILPLDSSLFSPNLWLETSVNAQTLSPRLIITDASDSPDGTSFGGGYKVSYGSAIPPTTVPEPSTTLLCGIALTGVLGYGWRRKHTA